MSIKVVIITGVTGALGSQLAKKYLNKGYFVVGIAGVSGKSNLQFKNNSYKEIPFDLGRLDTKRFEKLITILQSNIPGGFDSINLIHCAGIYFPNNDSNGQENFDISYSLHCRSLYLLSNYLLNFWRDENIGGCLVAISSNLTKRYNDNIDYIVSKSAMNTLVQLLSFRLGEFQIPCYTILPGIFHSPMSENIDESKIKYIRSKSLNNEIIDIDNLTSFIFKLTKEKKMYLSSQEFFMDYGNSLRF